jgi:phage terminase large subunit
MSFIKLIPTWKQHLSYQVLDNDTTRFLLMGGGAGGGKSWLGCEWLLRNCYLYPGSRWFIGRKELKRLMTTTYITWNKVCSYHKVPRSAWKLNGQYNYIEFVSGAAKGSRIDLIEMRKRPEDPKFERFGSLELTGGFIEEAGEVPFLAFDTIKSRVGRHQNKELGLVPKILLTCNPTQNYLYRLFYKPWKRGDLDDRYAFIQSLYKDNPHTADEYGEQLSTIDDPINRARLMGGEWEYENDNLTLMPFGAIVNIFNNVVEPSNDRYMTVDVARYGGDKIVLATWLGMDLYRMEIMSKQSLTVTAEHIRDMAQDEFVPRKNIVIDEDGVGGGVVDMLPGVHGFKGGRSPILRTDEPLEEMAQQYENLPAAYFTKENYRNLRSQCYFMLARRVVNGSIKISANLREQVRDEIVQELQQTKRKDTAPDAPLQVVPKDEIKEALGRSPDLADTLMMRMYFELLKENKMPAYNPPDPEMLAQRGGQVPFHMPNYDGGLGQYGYF